MISGTHEPTIPQDWPDGHVGVLLTDDDNDECIEVRIHGVKHFLHSTTAQELSSMLIARLDEWHATAITGGAEPV
jgi:hypothetical protein